MTFFVTSFAIDFDGWRRREISGAHKKFRGGREGACDSLLLWGADCVEVTEGDKIFEHDK